MALRMLAAETPGAELLEGTCGFAAVGVSMRSALGSHGTSEYDVDPFASVHL
jgi:hypothetical protein